MNTTLKAFGFLIVLYIRRSKALFFSSENIPNQTYLCASYTRLSQDDGDKEESNSIVNQKALIRDYISNRPELQLVEEYADDGYSGVNFERPDFKRMMQDVKSQRINCIIVKDLSRFARNYILLGEYMEQIFPYLGVRFIAINDGYDSQKTTSATDNMNITGSIMPVLMGTHQHLMSRKMFRCKCHTHFLCLFNRKARFDFIFGIKTDDVMMRFDFCFPFILFVFSISFPAFRCKIISITVNSLQYIFFPQHGISTFIQKQFAAALIGLKNQILFRCSIAVGQQGRVLIPPVEPKGCF